ncbi:TonB-dependent receptor [Novosphingobium sp. ERN07]|uniref:TonB-dependent receptor n=1 Tax=Novosphingobium sp. ERN07 TaxID=2726187 RepID=UPI0014571A2B|nr:TonB-dependent receptor [Novosphingobium sp. ERN07]NLR73481.1 TonB-dependent receptor [Novosphingobium sp. ERN07]
MLKKRLLLSVAFVAVLGAPAAFAQEAAAKSNSALDEQGEIIVTAQRRSERLTDVPIAISAKTGEALNAAGVTSAQNLGLVTPGLNYAVQGAFAQPTIRGIGTSVTGPGADANVSIYVDGVYQPSQTGNLFEFNNIERIEVLKGPQGTLFGRNATGGAISVVTADPGQDISFKAGASYGRFNQVRLDGYVNAPLSENVAANLSVQYGHNTGYVTNVMTNSKVAQAESFAARGKIKFDASETVSFVLAGNYSRTDDNSPFAVRPIDGNNIARQFGVTFPSGFYEVALDQTPSIITKQYGASLTAKIDLDAGTITSISSYQRIEPNLVSDIDNSPLFLATARIPTEEDNFTQELNYSSDFDGPINFIAGAFYYNDKTTTDLFITGASTASILTSVKTVAESAYGEINYDLSPELTLTGGLRFSSEEKSARGGIPGLELVNDSTRWNSWTPRAVIRYKLDPASSIYASYSRGFKSGNYNIVFLSPTPVEPETVDAFEIGYKQNRGGVIINTSAFYYKYNQIQVQIQTNSGSGLATILQNAASAEIYGADFEFTLPVSEAFSLQGGAAWTHARYKDFKGAIITRPLRNASGVAIGGNSQGPGDASGKDMIRTPEFTANLSGTYNVPLADGELQLSANGSYNSGFFWDPANVVEEGDYFILNARVSWLSPDKHYRLSVFGENLTDAKYHFYVNNTSTGNSGAPARPWSASAAINVYF